MSNPDNLAPLRRRRSKSRHKARTRHAERRYEDRRVGKDKPAPVASLLRDGPAWAGYTVRQQTGPQDAYLRGLAGLSRTRVRPNKYAGRK
jgi:hypothetical protein